MSLILSKPWQVIISRSSSPVDYTLHPLRPIYVAATTQLYILTLGVQFCNEFLCPPPKKNDRGRPSALGNGGLFKPVMCKPKSGFGFKSGFKHILVQSQCQRQQWFQEKKGWIWIWIQEKHLLWVGIGIWGARICTSLMQLKLTSDLLISSSKPVLKVDLHCRTWIARYILVV